MPSDHTAQTHLEQALGRQPLILLPTPGHSIDHVADMILATERIVELAQILRRLGLAADLEELDPDLPRLSTHGIQLARRVDDDALDVVRRHAVGDDDDVERFQRRLVAVGGALERICHLGQVRFEDLVEPRARRSAAQGPHVLEQRLHRPRGRHVGVPAVSCLRVAVVEEVDVETVGVVGGADRGDGRNRSGGLAPRPAGHGSAVVNEEEGVEGAQEGVRRVVANLHCIA